MVVYGTLGEDKKRERRRESAITPESDVAVVASRVNQRGYGEEASATRPSCSMFRQESEVNVILLALYSSVCEIHSLPSSRVPTI